MFRPTLGMVRASALSGRIGICGGDRAALAATVNEAQERLLTDPMAPDEGWWGGWARMAFNVQVVDKHAYISTPHYIARLILMDVCQQPVRIRNGFYEFLEFGVGLQPRPSACLTGGTLSQTCACGQITEGYERDNVVTLFDQTISPATIRIYPTDSADVGLRVLLQGLDQNAKQVTTVDVRTQTTIFGEWVTLTMPFVDSAYQYTSITGIQKAATQGLVSLFQVDPLTGNQISLSSMEPNEVTAAYRRYLVNGLPANCCNTPSGTVQIVAQAKLDFFPALNDTDYLVIQSIPAIIEECQSLRYSSMDSRGAPELEAKHHAKALQLLFGQLDHYMGKTQTAIRVPIFGSDRLRSQPV